MLSHDTLELLSHTPGHDGAVWEYRGGTRQGRVHRHVELELNLVTAGRAFYLVNERRYELRRGVEIWLFPHQEHVLIEASRDFAMWIVVFRPELLCRVCTTGAACELRGALPAGPFTKRFDEVVLRRLADLCAEIAEARDDPARVNAGLAYLVLSAWVAHGEAGRVTARMDVHPAVERAVRLMQDADGADLSVPAIAAGAGLSESQLSRLFRSQLGVPLVQYRQWLRLERFRELYGQGRRRNLTEAALAAGFGSYSHFHRAFKRAYGCSPREYSRRLGASG